MNSLELIQFLTDSAEEMEADYNVIRFLELRYDILSKISPHKTFSVEECSPHFFRDSADYILGNKEWSLVQKGNEYKANYVEWLAKYKKQVEFQS